MFRKKLEKFNFLSSVLIFQMKHLVNDAILYLYVIMYVLHNLFVWTYKCEKKYLWREVYMRHISNMYVF